MVAIKETKIVEGVIYIVHPDHRNKTPNKSQWTIAKNLEICCFRLSHRSNWLMGQAGWGLHLVNGRADYLGTNAKRTRKLFVARFEDRNGRQRWHGYPADPVERSRDMVPEAIANNWMIQALLRPAVISKLLRNKPCNL